MRQQALLACWQSSSHSAPLWIIMTSLYVYYRVQATQREAWLIKATQLQTTLSQYCESVQLSCRQEDPLTIMETYYHLSNVPAFQAHLQAELANIQPAKFLIVTDKAADGRHEEWFVDC